MAEPNAFNLSQTFSKLTGRKVSFVQSTQALDKKIGQIIAVYSLLPLETAIVVKADLPLMGSLAGTLVGLPDQAVTEHLRTTPMEELMRDSISEVLNVAAAAVSTEGRAVFTNMFTDPIYLTGAAAKVYKEPFHRSYFVVSIEGYQGGRFSILSPFVPSKK
jgi:hypothetical protein